MKKKVFCQIFEPAAVLVLTASWLTCASVVWSKQASNIWRIDVEAEGGKTASKLASNIF